jgi:hypothetical protein
VQSIPTHHGHGGSDEKVDFLDKTGNQVPFPYSSDHGWSGDQGSSNVVARTQAI